MPFKYLLLVLMAVFAATRRRIEAVDLLLVLMFTDMALYSARYVALFALITAPVLARYAEELKLPAGSRLSEFLARRALLLAATDARSRGHLWPAAALLVVGVAVVSGVVQRGFDPKVKPVAATEFLMRERIPGNMFNDDEFGDYLIYRGYPAYRVFFDGRSDMYGREKLKDYLAIAGREPGWEGVLEKYRITWIFYGTDSGLCRQLARERGWVRIYSDPVASVFVRDLPEYRHLIEDCGARAARSAPSRGNRP